MDVKKILGSSFSEDMTVQQLIDALKDVDVVSKDNFDKSVKELNKKVKDLDKELKDRMTDDEQKELKYQELLRNSEIAKLEKNYLSLGYDKELAEATACAQYDGDMEKVFANQEIFINSVKEKKDAEYLTNTPAPPAGSADNSAATQKDYNKAIDTALISQDMASAVSLINQQFNSNKEE